MKYWTTGMLTLGTLSAVALFSTSASAQALACETINTDSFAQQGLVIDGSEAVAAGEDFAIDHCRVHGSLGARTGADGQPYAIGFELRLPNDWNGDFVHQFNGGNDGRVVDAVGDLKGGSRSDNALARGYAVVSSDGGHDMNAHRDAGFVGGAKFGLDPEARTDYGYGAVAKLHPVALAMVETYYGNPAEYVYGVGSSNGGRHAMVAAARMPDQFDGLLAAYPGINLPRAAVQHAWDVQALLSVDADITKAFPPESLNLVAGGVLAACDGLDGLEDGLVFDIDACQAAFDVSTLQCTSDAADNCLSAKQVAALNKMHNGPVDSNGNAIYASWPWDTGLASPGWRGWKLEGRESTQFMPRIVALGAPSLAYIFSTPPVEVDGTVDALLDYLQNFDFDTDATAIDATDGIFTESAMSFMTPPGSANPQLAEFRDAGGKLIVFHGASDPVFSMNDTTAWYEKLDANNLGRAEEFAMYYRIPGMVHGTGGPSADNHDAFSALVNWVENNQQPDALVATVPADMAAMGETAGATRKLCPFPQVAYFDGTDAASADSFICR